MDFDAVVIGSGPAGATFARLAGGYSSVLLVDRRRLDLPPSGPGKCCGGLLAPDAQRMLARLELGFPGSLLVDPQLFSVRAEDLSDGSVRYYQRHYLNFDRELFDRWLAAGASAVAKTQFGAVFKGYKRIAGGFEVKLSSGGSERIVTARCLVGADGAASRLRRQAFPESTRPRYVAVQGIYEDRSVPSNYHAFFDASLTDFYGWAIPKGGRILVGLATLANHDARGLYDLFLEKVRKRLEIGEEVGMEGASLHRPGVSGDLCLGKEGIFLLGEAAGFISPSSAEGISYAFWSAMLLGEVLEKGVEHANARYERSALKIRLNLMGKLLKSPAMYNPALRKMILRSGIGSVR